MGSFTFSFLMRHVARLSATTSQSVHRNNLVFGFAEDVVFFAILVKAAIALSRCSFSWLAEIWTRMRACPFATTGRRIDDVNPFGIHVAREVRRQFCVIEHYRDNRVLAGSDVDARFVILSRKYFVFHSSLSRRSVDSERTSSTCSTRRRLRR